MREKEPTTKEQLDLQEVWKSIHFKKTTKSKQAQYHLRS